MPGIAQLGGVTPLPAWRNAGRLFALLAAALLCYGYDPGSAPVLVHCRVTDGPRRMVTIDVIGGRVASQHGCGRQYALMTLTMINGAHIGSVQREQ